MRSDITIKADSVKKAPKLFLFAGEKVKEFRLDRGMTLGRQTPTWSPDIDIDDFRISRHHGIFSVHSDLSGDYPGIGRRVFYTDTRSLNGTFINGNRLEPDKPYLLHNGDILSVSDKNETILKILFSESYVENDGWQKIPLDDQTAELEVGRQGELGTDDPRLSRHHASFFFAQRGWAIIDHNSLNGVWVEGSRIDQPIFLKKGDIILIAQHIFYFTGDKLICQAERIGGSGSGRGRGAGGKKGPVLSINIVERNVWTRFRKRSLLKDISLEVASGEMVLILGGSGAGKTTFMNAVMGYEPAEGTILYNNMDIYNEYKKMMYEIGYVPQQELLRMNDTVYHTLLNAAHMRLASGLPERSYEESVDKTLSVMGLEREKNSPVSKLSGGQKKRLSIGVEYIGNPSLFFLDEPDSGLDGSMATGLMKNLRKIADEGKIVMVISHYPDRTPELFNKIIVLAKDTRDNCGHLVFYGSPDEAKQFFETETIEAIVRKINRPDEDGEGKGDYYIEKFRSYRNRNV